MINGLQGDIKQKDEEISSFRRALAEAGLREKQLASNIGLNLSLFINTPNNSLMFIYFIYCIQHRFFYYAAYTSYITL